MVCQLPKMKFDPKSDCDRLFESRQLKELKLFLCLYLTIFLYRANFVWLALSILSGLNRTKKYLRDRHHSVYERRSLRTPRTSR